MIEVQIDKASSAKFRRDMKEFTRLAGISVGEGVAVIAKDASKQLASKVQPWGLSNKVGDKFQKSIAKQVARATRAGNIKGTPGDALTVHAANRDGRGRVSRGLPERGQFKRKPLDPEEVNRAVEKRQKAAGRLKAAWIAAGEAITTAFNVNAKGISRKITGVGQWIRRHVDRKEGSAKWNLSRGISSYVDITNDAQNIERHQKTSDAKAALAIAYRAGTREMKKILRKLQKTI